MSAVAATSAYAEASSAQGLAADTAGALMFARFAYPPNAMGYCGPDAAGELLERVAAGPADTAGLGELARGFAGAWPYLELIARAAGLPDPLDLRVVEAYWIGNDLLRNVTPRRFAASLTDRFAARLARGGAERMLAPLGHGGVPHHGFHVFAVYPWVGLLRGRTGDAAAAPLHVLDRCRIRWGRVLSVQDDTAVVASRPLEWDGRRLRLGSPRAESARTGLAGLSLTPVVAPGDWVALHWDWVCQPLRPAQLAALRWWTWQQISALDASGYPAPARVLA